MSWTDMINLADEINKMKEISKKNFDDKIFPVKDSKLQTYYIDYKCAKHLESVLTKYNSEEMGEVKKMLLKIWENEPDLAKEVIPIVLSAYSKTKNNVESQIKEVDLYNYMM